MSDPVDLDAIRSALDRWRSFGWSMSRGQIADILDVAPALLAELSAAREEIERLRGMEPCSGWIDRGSAGMTRCNYRRKHHNEELSRLIGHDFLGGAFDATTEGGS